MRFDEAVAFALVLPGTELGKTYGKPAIKLSANKRALLFPRHEADTSLGVALDVDTIEILKETEPETFWQSPHYVGWEGVLIRYGSTKVERVKNVIERAGEWIAAKPAVRSRRRE